MPITARLSQAFYERLGEQVTNELVDWFNQIDMHYQSTLHQLNDANATRFEAQLDRRLAEVRAEMHVEFAQVNAQTTARFDRIEDALARTASEVETRARFDNLFAQMATNTELAEVSARLDARLDAMNAQMATRADLANLRVELIERFDDKMATQVRWMIGLMLPLTLAVIGLWFRK